MADIWGFAGGLIAGQQASDQHQAVQQELQQNREMQPYRIAESKAKSDLDAIAVKQAQQSLAQQQAMIEYLHAHVRTSASADATAQGDPMSASRTANESHAGMLETFADANAFAGRTEEAGKLYTQASELKKNQATIEKEYYETQSKQRDYFTGLLNDVHDQDSWRVANILAAQNSGRPTPFMDAQGNIKTPYSPQLVQMIRNALLTQKDQSAIKKDKAETAYAQAGVGLRQKQVELDTARIEEVKAHTTYLKKHGGVGNSYTAAEMTQLTDLVGTHYDLSLPGERNRAAGLAEAGAQRAHELISTGTKAPQAYQQAFAEQQKSGAFVGLTPLQVMRGMGWDKPAPLPPKADKLKENTVYTVRGKSQVYFNGPEGLKFYTQEELKAGGYQ